MVDRLRKRIDDYQKGDSGTMVQKANQLMTSIDDVLQIESTVKKEIDYE